MTSGRWADAEEVEAARREERADDRLTSHESHEKTLRG
jgi:hypothetical protein